MISINLISWKGSTEKEFRAHENASPCPSSLSMELAKDSGFHLRRQMSTTRLNPAVTWNIPDLFRGCSVVDLSSLSCIWVGGKWFLHPGEALSSGSCQAGASAIVYLHERNHTCHASVPSSSSSEARCIRQFPFVRWGAPWMTHRNCWELQG